MKPVEATILDKRSVYRRRWSTSSLTPRHVTAPEVGAARRETPSPLATDPGTGAEVRPRAELPAWNDALARVVSLLGTLQEHVGKMDAADAPTAIAEPTSVDRSQLLRDIARAQQTARNAQRRVAEALGAAPAGQDSVRP